MTNKAKRIVLLTEVELKKTLSRLTSEIIEKVKNLDNLLLVGIPSRGVDLAEALEEELFCKTGIKITKGTIDPTFYRDDQNRVGTRQIKAADIPTTIEKKEINDKLKKSKKKDTKEENNNESLEEKNQETIDEDEFNLTLAAMEEEIKPHVIFTINS